MQGISRRELARRLDVSETTVRRHVDSGALADALLRDGSLDPRKAVDALTKALSGAKVVPRELADARTRRLRVQVARLVDEVAHLRQSAIPPADLKTALDEQVIVICRHLRTIPKAASVLAGQTAAEVLPALKSIVFDALEANTGDHAGEDEWWNDGPEPAPVDLKSMSPNALLAKRVDLTAQALEIRHALARGDLINVAEAAQAFEEKLAVLKSALFALPGRVAHAFESASPAEACDFVTAEIEEAISAL